MEHALHLTNFISSVKPFVCLNFDLLIGGFNLVRQDKCDKHQPNPLLTGQLLFGIVQTNNPNNGKVKGNPSGSIIQPSRHNFNQEATHAARITQNLPHSSRKHDQISGMLPETGPNQSKLKHYQIKRIDL